MLENPNYKFFQLIKVKKWKHSGNDKLVISKTFLILVPWSFTPLVAMKMMKIVYIQFRDIPPLYEATGTPCVYTFVSSALWVSVGSSFFLSLSRRVILSQAAVVSKESLLPRVKHMSSATTSDVNLTSVLRRSKSVSVSKGTNSSSFYESSLTKGLSRSRNNREWTSKDFGEIVLFSNPFFRFGFNYSRNLGNI